MADFNGIDVTVTLTSGVLVDVPAIAIAEAGRDPVKMYVMAWKDPDCGGPSPTYRTWTVENAPDPTGAEYDGVKCGGTAISGAFVLDEWLE